MVPARPAAVDHAAQLADDVAQVETQIQQAQLASRADGAPQPIRAADVFRLATAMPDAPDMPGIILQLSKLAIDSGVEFTSIQPTQEPVAGAGYQALQINLAFSGNFYGLSDFLYRLRTLVGVRGGTLQADGRLFTVEKLAFSEGKPSFPSIDATLTLDAFVYGAPAAAAPTSTDPAATTGTTTTTTTPAPAPTGATAAGTTGVNG